MRLGTLFSDLLTITVLAAIGYFVYFYLYGGDSGKEDSVRYQENLQDDIFNQSGRIKESDDDCYRFANPVQMETCIEAKK